jgi:hypothetical protein
MMPQADEDTSLLSASYNAHEKQRGIKLALARLRGSAAQPS